METKKVTLEPGLNKSYFYFQFIDASPESPGIRDIQTIKAIRENYVFRRYGKHFKAQPSPSKKYRR